MANSLPNTEVLLHHLKCFVEDHFKECGYSFDNVVSSENGERKLVEGTHKTKVDLFKSDGRGLDLRIQIFKKD